MLAKTSIQHATGGVKRDRVSEVATLTARPTVGGLRATTQRVAEVGDGDSKEITVRGANVSARVVRTASGTSSSMRPSRGTSRVSSTVRNWSSTTWPSLPSKRQGIRVGYGRPFVVIGATMTVVRCDDS